MSGTPWTDERERVGKIRSSGALMGVVPAVYVRELKSELSEARAEIENKQYSITCDAERIQLLCETVEEQRAEIEQYKMGKISPADYYSMAEAERELCNEIAKLKQKYSEMNEERIKWLGDNMKQAKLIEQMREAQTKALDLLSICANSYDNNREVLDEWERIRLEEIKGSIAALSAAERSK